MSIYGKGFDLYEKEDKILLIVANLLSHNIQDNKTNVVHIRKRPSDSAEWSIVGSCSHQSDELKSFIEKHPGAEIISMGSLLKLCSVAEGAANLYPRIGLTSELDMAASQPVVKAAGRQALRMPEMTSLRCNENESSLLNPHFLVCGNSL